MTKKERDQITTTLWMCNVAGTRNVPYVDRLEALYKDLASIIEGKNPEATGELIKSNK